MATLKDVVDSLSKRTEDGTLQWSISGDGWEATEAGCRFYLFAGMNYLRIFYTNKRGRPFKDFTDSGVIAPLDDLVNKRPGLDLLTKDQVLQKALSCLTHKGAT